MWLSKQSRFLLAAFLSVALLLHRTVVATAPKSDEGDDDALFAVPFLMQDSGVNDLPVSKCVAQKNHRF